MKQQPPQEMKTPQSSLCLNPQEEALQSLCKQILKSRIFLGCYQERLYVEAVKGYRDIVSLHLGERDLEKLLLDIKAKLSLFYQNASNMWIGVTHGDISNGLPRESTRDTYLWVELDNIAFGQYWFSIKTIRFREGEIILRLKMIRPASNDTPEQRQFAPTYKTPTAQNIHSLKLREGNYKDTDVPDLVGEQQITMQDFWKILRDWGTSIKRGAYNFMSNDITQENIKEFLQFLGLLIVSILSGIVVAIKYLGIFSLRFMFEFSRFTQVASPIILKVIDVFNKIIGGFYILVAMIWKDAFGNRRDHPPPQTNLRALEYNRPLYKSIEFNVRQKSNEVKKRRSTEFERKCQ